MKILAYVHLYHPVHNAGAEAMLHQILLELKERGHEPVVACRTPTVESYEGIPLIDVDNMELVKTTTAWSDIVFTHLDLTARAVKFAKSKHKPIVHIVHNDDQVPYWRLNYKTAQLFVANSEWIKKTIKVPNVPTIVMYPPTDPKKYEVETKGDCVTLVNLTEKKGGKIFWQLARIMPDVKFLGVKGGYGIQELHKEDLPNVTILEHTTDIRQAYSKSKIIIMPSFYESWGRVAIEAAASGIPVIAHPTPGLKESLGDSGIFIDRDDIASLVETIRSLVDNSAEYEKYSKLVKARSNEIFEAFEGQMNSLEEQLEIIVKRYRRILPEGY
jgi:glycosyltransferase involved in cell wall biosynthesis